MASTIRAAMSDRGFPETDWPMVEAVRRLIGACERAGELPLGTDAEDLLQLLGCMTRIPPVPDGEARTGRLPVLVFRGLGAADAAPASSPHEGRDVRAIQR